MKELIVVEPNHVETVALATVIKEKATKEAKASLDATQYSVDFLCRIQGTISKSAAIEGEPVAPTVDLINLPTVCALLKQLNIGHKRLREALGEVKLVEELNAKTEPLANVFTECARDVAGDMPRVTKGVSARVTSVLSARIVQP